MVLGPPLLLTRQLTLHQELPLRASAHLRSLPKARHTALRHGDRDGNLDGIGSPRVHCQPPQQVQDLAQDRAQLLDLLLVGFTAELYLAAESLEVAPNRLDRGNGGLRFRRLPGQAARQARPAWLPAGRVPGWSSRRSEARASRPGRPPSWCSGFSAGNGARGDVTAVSIRSSRFPHRASCWARRVSRRLSRSSRARKNAPTASSASAAADAPRTNGGSHQLRLGRGSDVNVGIAGDRPPGGCSSEPGSKRARDLDRTSVSQRLASLPGSSSSSLTRSTASPRLTRQVSNHGFQFCHHRIDQPPGRSSRQITHV